MEDRRREQVSEIRNQIIALQADENRLKVLIRSKFPSEKYKARAQADLTHVRERLKELQTKFGNLAREQ